MGFLDRFRRKESPAAPSHTGTPATPLVAPTPSTPSAPPARLAAAASGPASEVTAALYTGDETLEVVGESNYQDALWRIVGLRRGSQVRHQVIAVLVPEPNNPYDGNAINVQVDGSIVGYLSGSTRLSGESGF